MCENPSAFGGRVFYLLYYINMGNENNKKIEEFLGGSFLISFLFYVTVGLIIGIVDPLVFCTGPCLTPAFNGQLSNFIEPLLSWGAFIFVFILGGLIGLNSNVRKYTTWVLVSALISFLIFGTIHQIKESKRISKVPYPPVIMIPN